MTVACKRNYTLTVNTPITVDAYWPLDEASGNRVDKVNSVALVPNGTNVITAQPALFNNGLAFPEKGAALSSIANTATAFLSPGNPNAGWSWWFWFKVLDWPNPALTPWNEPPLMLWGDPGFGAGAGWRITVDWDPTDLYLFCSNGSVLNSMSTQWSDYNGNIYCGTPFPATIGLWYFVHMFYDPVAAQVGYQINNGSPVYAVQSGGPPAAPLFTGAPRNGQLAIGQQWRLADTSTIALLVDEMGFKLSRILTPAEVSFLYNNGAGMTWPL